MNWLNELVVGDKVGVKMWDSTGLDQYYIGQVKKVTPKGFINVDGILYEKSGRRRGGHGQLVSIHDEQLQTYLKKYNDMNLVKCTIKRLSAISTLTPEQACAINQIMGWDNLKSGTDD